MKNKSKRNLTLSAAEALSPVQATVLAELLSGKTITDAATAANVSRMTVHSWLREDFAFQAAWNRARSELCSENYSRLERLAVKSVDCLEKAIDANDVKIALEIVKGMGILGRSPVGSEYAGELEAEAAENRQQVFRKMMYSGLLEPDEVCRIAAELS